MQSKAEQLNEFVGYLKFSGIIFFSSILTIFILISLFVRWRKIKIFISYNLENEDVVKNLTRKISDLGFKVMYIPYEQLDYDQIILNVNKKIKSADVVIVVPGNRQKANYTDAEVMSATLLNKIILILKTELEQHYPNTALNGLPTFEINRLQNFEYKPLKTFIDIIFWDKRYVFESLMITFVHTLFTSLGILVLGFLKNLFDKDIHGILNNILLITVFWVYSLIALFIFSFILNSKKIFVLSRLIKKQILNKIASKEKLSSFLWDSKSYLLNDPHLDNIVSTLSDSILIRKY